MLIRKSSGLTENDVTPRHIYLNRRKFMGAGAAGLVGAMAAPHLALAANIETPLPNLDKTNKYHQLFPDAITPKDAVTHYNNYYEFGTAKQAPSRNAPNWTPDPAWPVKFEGHIEKPRTMGLADIMKLAPLEERIYRMRCVEAWSVVVPWIGFPLSVLLKQLKPTSDAKYVTFQTFYDSNVMLSSRSSGIRFPYVEGLRMDEAMNPLTLLTFGMYGDTLPNQDGAPMRLIVPWKYGFKGIKSIVKIGFSNRQPPTTWNLAASREYGFYSNVNPNRDHPRWSQKYEQRLGGGLFGFGKRIPTVIFNGYGDEVAHLYKGMDLINRYF